MLWGSAFSRRGVDVDSSTQPKLGDQTSQNVQYEHLLCFGSIIPWKWNQNINLEARNGFWSYLSCIRMRSLGGCILHTPGDGDL